MDPLITKTIQGALEDKIFNKIIALNLNIPNPILRAVISRVAEVEAVELVKQVTQASNTQLNVIPQNIIGPVNPVDVTNSNNGPTEITNNIDGIIQQQLLMQTTDRIVTKLQSQLRLALPTDKLGIINFDALSATLVQSITPTVGKTITTAVGGFADAVFGRGQKPKATTTNVETLYSTLSPEEALKKTDELFVSSAANSALEEAKKFDINSTDNKEKLEVLEKGFTDPNANYPSKDYAGISETNKLAQGDPRGTIVSDKNKNRMKGAKLPGGEAWDEPESAFRGAYPYNKVTQTESGHVIEIDDTPGSERLHIYHKSGTYVEIDSNGSVIKRTKGSSYEIIDRNGKISIAGRADISVNGACNIFVGNDANIEVEGDVNLTCHNDITAQAGGTFNMSAVEEFNIASGNVNIEAYYTMNQKAATMNIHGKEAMHLHSNADIKVEAINLYEKTSGSMYTQADGAISIKAADDTSIEGSNLHWNSGTASDSVGSVIAGSSNIGVISGRKDTTDNNKDDPLVLSLADSRSIALEEETQTTDDYNNQKNLIISEGFANAADLTKPPTAVDSTTVESEQSNFVEPDAKLKTVTQLPGNYNLTPNFTVEMLSSKAGVSRDPIRGHEGATYGEIVYNLQAIALNVLEPVKKIYPNMFVTSAFRDPGNAANAKTSQHPLGQGVDIQFKGITKQDYYDIASKLAKVLKYDQLILEYCSYTNNPWIHISYSVKNRSQVLTFFNHKTHSQGLTQLA
ncbi:hypothetical protein UFOVP242_120 [uncultured Caudovirales phage]|uniref:Peptidase M15A, C-terminal n=1 Tax=uncultured Caudovirales phage TaxID=2100421 RepID=A0A6J7WUW9_9CAUD|nr:hypothetical protein UFOVP242_120 [uncultured Caudovirales phage]